MATTLKMYYIGIIAHIGTKTEKEFAVIPLDDVHGHRFELILSPKAVPIPLGDDVTFSIPTGPAKTTEPSIVSCRHSTPSCMRNC